MQKRNWTPAWAPSLENWDGGLKIFYGTSAPVFAIVIHKHKVRMHDMRSYDYVPNMWWLMLYSYTS